MSIIILLLFQCNNDSLLLSFLHFSIIYSFDRDKVRYDTMNDLLKREGVVCVKTFNEDFLKVSKSLILYQEVL